MYDRTRDLIRHQTAQAGAALQRGWQVMRRRGPDQILFWIVALIVGVVAGTAAVLFRSGIFWLQATLYGTDDPAHLHSFARTLPWWLLLGLPICGGLVVGLILQRFTPDGRVRSVADVIEGAALDRGRVEVKAGFASALASLITLSSGGSSGREGPVVHLAAVISTLVSNLIRADGVTGRNLLGCAVAAAVSASFNAPIAGALFALEVILRHFAVRSFTPIAIAAVAGTVVSRLVFGNVHEFSLTPRSALAFYVELPAFVLLGLVCGLVAVVLMWAIFFADDLASHLQRRLRMPGFLRPAVAGALLGGIAIFYPHIIGVGYETTTAALHAQLQFGQIVVFVIIKVIAVAITMGGRMGGGVFSPSLMVGALTGLAFGLIATAAIPNYSGDGELYALAGMGAVAAAVLGAPISTTLIVFELTGGWQTGLAVMVAVSLSTALASRLVDRSFFLTLLEKKGTRLSAGPQVYLMSQYAAGFVMRGMDSPRAAPEAACRDLMERGIQVAPEATLDLVLPLFEEGGHAFVPVVVSDPENDEDELVGAVFHVDALRAFNRALSETAAEEHA